MARRRRVVVVSTVRLVRQALLLLLAESASLQVAGSAPSVLQALPLIGRGEIDAVVLTTPADGEYVAAELIYSKFPHMRLVVLGVSDDDAAGWIEAGAADALPVEASLAALEEAVEDGGGVVLHSTRTTAVLLDRFRLHAQNEREQVRSKLTRREWEVARLLAEGLTDKEIARELSITVATAKSHVHSILRKLGARRRAEVRLRLRGQRTPSTRADDGLDG